jgi:phosphoribosylformylglycinamidine cyclo-ligase
VVEERGTPGESEPGAPLTYAESGVDITAGELAVERIKAHVRATFRPEVIGDLGGFGGLFAFDPTKYREPVLASSTDGVGTKSRIAQLAGRYDTIGLDLVAMSVDDIAVQGAEPLFFLDYISVGRLDPDMIDDIVSGVARGCRQAGCALIGGEMSEHPGIMAPGEFDLVGFVVGVVERSKTLPSGIAAGDRVIGLHSPGLRSNGYSLARSALLERANRSLDAPAWPGAHHSLADELLRPSVIYAPSMAALREAVDVHGFAHVTGGGIGANLERVLPKHCDAAIRRGTWDEPRIFAEIQSAGSVTGDEMERVFNLGLGMLVVVPDTDVLHALDVARASGHDAWIVGDIVAGKGRARVIAP